MDATDVRTILSAATTLEAQRKVAQEELAALRESRQRITATITLMPHNPNSDVHWSEQFVIKADALQAKIDAYKSALPAAQHKVNATIALVSSPLERKVLTMRYCARLPWAKIAQATSYSVSHLYRVHDQALKEIAQYL